MARGPVVKAKDFRGSARRLLATMSRERPLMAAVLVLGVAGVTLAVLGPRMLGAATDLVFAGAIGHRLPAGITKQQVVERLRTHGEGHVADMIASMRVVPGQGIDFTAVGKVLGLVAVVYAAASLLNLAQARLATTIAQRTAFRLREQAEAKLSRLPVRYFDTQPRGEILSRATNDIDNLAQTLQQTLSQIVTSLLTIAGVLSVMFWMSWLLAVIALVTVPVSVWLSTVIAKRAQPHFMRQWGTTGRLNAYTEEMYTGHALVRVFGRQREAVEAFEEHNRVLREAAYRAQFISGTIQPTMTLLSNLTYVLVAVIGGIRVASGAISLGEVQAFVQYSRQFGQPVTQVASMANLLQSGVASAERVFELLDAREQTPDPLDPVLPARVEGRVAFDDVSFRYDEDKRLIENLSLTIEPGRTVAIVGRTGAGKTTVVNLLMRFYEPDGGRITLDGVDVTTMDRAALRANIGAVLQDTWLFGGTIADNIAYGAGGVPQERIVEAARAANVDRFVRTLADGYDTVIDEDGSNISAGQRQLIAIARAFVTEPAVLVLDEATSSVDPRTEVLIKQAMNSLRKGRTSFVIAHRLSTVRDADVIVVMDAGRIVEQGSHRELLAARGAYARLYADQFTLAGARDDERAETS